MRRIIDLQTADDFLLKIVFDDNVEKIFDLKPYFKYPVFAILNNPENFKSAVNKNYFIEWPDHEVDLSADTLWHEGKEVKTPPSLAAEPPARYRKKN